MSSDHLLNIPAGFNEVIEKALPKDDEAVKLSLEPLVVLVMKLPEGDSKSLQVLQKFSGMSLHCIVEAVSQAEVPAAAVELRNKLLEINVLRCKEKLE